MNKQKLFSLNGRLCYDFPIESKGSSFAVKPGYSRVIIPLTQTEQRNSRKRIHVQIVRTSRLKPIIEKPLKLREAHV